MHQGRGGGAGDCGKVGFTNIKLIELIVAIGNHNFTRIIVLNRYFG